MPYDFLLKIQLCTPQQVPNPTPLNPTPATCHKRKRKLHCSFRNVALQKLHCNIRLPAVRKSFLPKAALQQANNCSATLEKLHCRKVALSCRFPADFRPPRLGPAEPPDLERNRGVSQTSLFSISLGKFLLVTGPLRDCPCRFSLVIRPTRPLTPTL